MRMMISKLVRCVAVCVAAVALGGCAGGSPPELKQYSEAPNSHKPRLAVYTFQSQADPNSTIPETARGEFASDEAADMFDASGRFQVIMRRQFVNMLRDQRKQDMFKNGQLVTPGSIEGVDYVLTGSIANLSIKKEAKPLGFMQKMTGMFSKAASKKQVNVTVQCNVGLRMVDLATGDEVVTNNSQFDRTGGAKSLGIDMMESSTKFGELPVTEEDREQVIRLALDDAVTKSLPKIDRYIKSLGPVQPTGAATQPTRSGTPVAPGATTNAPRTTAAPQQAVKICPACKGKNDPAATICKNCGGNL